MNRVQFHHNRQSHSLRLGGHNDDEFGSNSCSMYCSMVIRTHSGQTVDTNLPQSMAHDSESTPFFGEGKGASPWFGQCNSYSRIYEQ